MAAKKTPTEVRTGQVRQTELAHERQDDLDYRGTVLVGALDETSNRYILYRKEDRRWIEEKKQRSPADIARHWPHVVGRKRALPGTARPSEKKP